MLFSNNNRRLIIRKIQDLEDGIEGLPSMPKPGDFPSPGFLSINLPDPVADGFDMCYIFCNGIVLNTRTGFHYDTSRKLDQIGRMSTLIHHYTPDGTVVSHSKYIWMDVEVYFLGVLTPRQ